MNRLAFLSGYIVVLVLCLLLLGGVKFAVNAILAIVLCTTGVLLALFPIGLLIFLIAIIWDAINPSR